MTKFYKLLAADMCHHGFTYKEGLNVDTLPFDPSGDCKPGGLYYTILRFLPYWYCQYWSLIADVTVPEDARVYAEPCGMKWKADRIVLSNIRPLREFLKTLDEDTLCVLLRDNGRMLEYVENQTEILCCMAVHQTSYALEYVKNQTEEMCLAAVKKNSHVLFLVRDLTVAIHRAAERPYPYVIFP